jgi:hypothetical protein
MITRILFYLILLTFLFLAETQAQFDYTKIKSEAISLRDRYAKIYAQNLTWDEKEDVLSEASKALTEILVKKIIPEWYGTAWHNAGTSQDPRRGKIACSYFVSTVLRDAGFMIDRIKVAQQSPVSEAKTIACGEKIYEFEFNNLQELAKQTQSLPEGLYFIGVRTYHVGFYLKNNEGEFFIHSNYTGNRFVESQPLMHSVLKTALVVFIVPITHNRTLVKKWLTKESIKTVLD